MRIIFICLASTIFLCCRNQQSASPKIFDVHLHGAMNASQQISKLSQAGVYKAAISSSWDLQNTYRNHSKIDFVHGLMLPCPEGKVPYSLQNCYNNGEDWPPLNWVEEQIQQGRIDYFGELLNQYYGISPSDSLLYPYYKLAQQYNVPVGIHTGGAGPNHGCPNFKMEMGNPMLLKKMLTDFPNLKVWIMHSGDQSYKETIEIMKEYERVFADISVISNPDITSVDSFSVILKSFIDSGLEDRLMFGTDNGDITKVIGAVESVGFLSAAQKSKLYSQNAERFFSIDKN